MNAIRSVVKMHTRDHLLWFIAPWGFQLTAFLVSLLDEFLRQGRGITSPGGGDIYAFYFVAGIFSVNDTFPFAMGFSVRRRDFLQGTLVMAALLFAVTALVLVTLGVLESQFTAGWGVSLHFFALPYLSAGSVPQQYWVVFSLLLSVFSLGFAIGSLYRRFGNGGLWIVFAFVLPMLTTGIMLLSYLNRWGVLFAWFSQYTAFELALGLLPVTMLFLFVTYLLMCRAVA